MAQVSFHGSRWPQPRMISTRFKFLFLHVPKTGGNSVQKALVGFSDDQIISPMPFQDGIERFDLRNSKYATHKHSTLRDYQQQLPPGLFNGLYKFATLRNPWDRLVSMYFSPHRGVTRWRREEFVTLIRDTPTAAHYLNDTAGTALADGLDQVLRFEHLQADFESVCQRLGLGKIKLPQINVSRRRHYSYYYDDETMAMVAQRCADEIRMGQYTFSVVRD